MNALIIFATEPLRLATFYAAVLSGSVTNSSEHLIDVHGPNSRVTILRMSGSSDNQGDVPLAREEVLTCPEVRGSYTAYAVAVSNWSGGMQLGQSVTTNPNGACNYLHDVKLAPFGGSASIWNGSAITYNVGFSLFGFSFSNLVSNDKTSVVTSWTNNGSVTTYLCGPDNTASPLGQAITYNSSVG